VESAPNLTTWQDHAHAASSAWAPTDVLMQRLTSEELRELGNELRPGLPIGLLFWLAEQGQLPHEDWIAASLPDFVLAHIGRTEPSIDATNAMAHGLLNLETLDWHYAVMTKLGLNRLHWPRLRRHGEQVALLKIGSRTIPCYTPIGDYQCAMAGSLLRYGELSLNISTGSQVSLLKPRLEFGNYQMRPFFDGRFLATITHIPAGRALAMLARLLSELAPAQAPQFIGLLHAAASGRWTCAICFPAAYR
jgi:sugar (pentulose or hexulose) kinase